MKSGFKAHTARMLAAGVLVAGPVGLSLVGCQPPAPYADCGAVDTVPHSDVGAWEIQAHNTTCTIARTVAHVVHTNAHGQPYTYLSWTCTRGLPQHGLGLAVWCNGPGDGVITWTSV